MKFTELYQELTPSGDALKFKDISIKKVFPGSNQTIFRSTGDNQVSVYKDSDDWVGIFGGNNKLNKSGKSGYKVIMIPTAIYALVNIFLKQATTVKQLKNIAEVYSLDPPTSKKFDQAQTEILLQIKNLTKVPSKFQKKTRGIKEIHFNSFNQRKKVVETGGGGEVIAKVKAFVEYVLKLTRPRYIIVGASKRQEEKEAGLKESNVRKFMYKKMIPKGKQVLDFGPNTFAVKLK